jgi:hypothetical protein
MAEEEEGLPSRQKALSSNTFMGQILIYFQLPINELLDPSK